MDSSCIDSCPRRVVTFTGPESVEVQEETLRPPSASEVRVKTELTAISPGTERLLYEGNHPSGLAADSSLSSLQGDLSYPMAYGYAAVGRVDAIGANVDAHWKGRRVFAFQPHTSHFVAAPDDLIALPETVSMEDGVLIPNVETAVNFVLDGRPQIGERVAVFGQGVVGLLTTALLSRFPLERLITVDPVSDRRARSREWGATQSLDPEDAEGLRQALNVRRAEAVETGRGEAEGADLVYELSGRPSVLSDALQVTGFDGRLVVGSWYGDKQAPIDLGGRFHRSRIRIISSQVSSIDPDLRGRWSKARRLQEVRRHLEALNPGRLVTDRFRVDEAPKAYREMTDSTSPMLQPVLLY